MQAVIFDMDGVIVDSEYHWRKEEEKLFSRIFIGVTKEELDITVGMNIRGILEMFKEKLDPNTTREDFFTEFNRLALDIYSNKVVMNSGIKDLLDRISQKGIPIALASSSRNKWVDIVIDRFSIRDYFRHIVTANDVNFKAKPAPDIYLLTAEKLGIPPHLCVAIEDSMHGVSSAKDAGMFCIGYNGGSHENQDISRADMIVKDFNEIDIGELCKQ